MASGWNLWVWLECIGVVSGCYCKEEYIYMYITYPYILHLYILALFCRSIPTSLFILKMVLFF